MSLGINATTPEGIVLAADSRQSYRNQKGMVRIGSDSASKIFKINNRTGLIVAGLAFLPEAGIPKNIGNFIEEFKEKTNIEKFELKEIAKKLGEFFKKKYPYKKQLEKLPKQIEIDLKNKGCEILEINEEKYHVKFKFKDPSGVTRDGIAEIEKLQFILAGYNSDGTHQVYMIYIPGNKPEEKRSSHIKSKEYGASWIGQTDVVSRIVLGFDGRMGNLPFIQQVGNQIGHNIIKKQLRSLEYIIQWGTMTLQDAIDFSELAIETTIAIQRFSDGIVGEPGDMPGVGGPIDIAVITHKKGFVWVNKKNLKIDDKEIDLDQFEDLKTSKRKNKNNSRKN